MEKKFAEASLPECPICYNYIGSPIYACCNGHVICQVCLTKLQNLDVFQCSICKAVGLPCRQLTLEQLLEKQTENCKLCDENILFLDNTKHLQTCKGQPLPCIINECTWTYKLNDFKTNEDIIQNLLDHVKTHNFIVHYNQSFNEDHILSCLTEDEIKHCDTYHYVSRIADTLLFSIIKYNGPSITLTNMLWCLSDEKYFLEAENYGMSETYLISKSISKTSIINKNESFIIKNFEIVKKYSGFIIHLSTELESRLALIKNSQCSDKSWHFPSPVVQSILYNDCKDITPKDLLIPLTLAQHQCLGTMLILYYLSNHQPTSKLTESGREFLSLQKRSRKINKKFKGSLMDFVNKFLF